jgi:hypothetical protein
MDDPEIVADVSMHESDESAVHEVEDESAVHQVEDESAVHQFEDESAVHEVEDDSAVPEVEDSSLLPLELLSMCLEDAGLRFRTLSRSLRDELDASRPSLHFVAAAPAAGMLALVTRCTSLRTVSLHGCVHADDELIAGILALLPRLSSVDVSRCPKLTTHSLVALRSRLARDALVADGTFWSPSPLLTPEQVCNCLDSNTEGLARAELCRCSATCWTRGCRSWSTKCSRCCKTTTRACCAASTSPRPPTAP